MQRLIGNGEKSVHKCLRLRGFWRARTHTITLPTLFVEP